MRTKTKQFSLKDISAYKKSENLANEVWNEVSKWKFFEQKTVGDQLVRAVDSISANIAEGFGRHHRKDKAKFYYNARGSTYEVSHWINTAYERELVTKDLKIKWLKILNDLPREINTIIKLTMKHLKE